MKNFPVTLFPLIKHYKLDIPNLGLDLSYNLDMKVPSVPTYSFPKINTGINFKFINFNEKIINIRKQLITNINLNQLSKLSKFKISNYRTSFLKNIDIDSINDLANSIGKINFNITPDGIVSSSGRTVSIEEVEEVVNKVLENFRVEERLESIENGINSLISEVSSLKEPIAQKILLNFVISLLVTFIVTFSVPSNLDDTQVTKLPQKREVISTIKKEVTSLNFAGVHLDNYRVTKADNLNVRSGPGNKYPILANFKFGKLVKVIKKKKKWTLVEWVDPKGEGKIKGWVFTRYLSKIS